MFEEGKEKPTCRPTHPTRIARGAKHLQRDLAQGIHRERLGLKSFQVLTVTQSRERVTRMAEAFKLIDEKVKVAWDKRCEARVFRFAARDTATPGRLLKYDWVNGRGVPAPLVSIPDDL